MRASGDRPVTKPTHRTSDRPPGLEEPLTKQLKIGDLAPQPHMATTGRIGPLSIRTGGVRLPPTAARSGPRRYSSSSFLEPADGSPAVSRRDAIDRIAGRLGFQGSLDDCLQLSM
jgi:hypothetical protein